ncbi:macrophage colony-stimulating factor 1 isoform X1 [Erinaceus europaeus]|uniref:Macrophage colony-stimulating factor 1 n=1 Tax=Erinaceus europaeus TaxID=9365 RepID=A0A1S3A4X1_ERIEU|nr:macrophage colony-stimulating factor 1 isoform X1 [Erinaceus europaeus]XP_060057908.1 macrophage colony-stimulating factor 1 isoform X1 [Erinaceus europaeus]
MTARGAAGRCPPTTWLGPWLLLACLLVSRSAAEEVSENCSHMIGNGHLKILQQLIDSQMETSCQIAFEFVDPEQLKDPVCYLKKAFLLVRDIMEDTLRFRDNTPNAITIIQLQELSLNLKSCFTKDYEEQDKACVRTFNETPLQLLEKIKNVFNQTKTLLKKDWNIFSKNCNDSFAKCSSQDVVTKPDCNCLYPKATPSGDLASVSPQQTIAPSKAQVAGLTWSGSEGVEDSSLLPDKQPLHRVDAGSAKQRPPRSTCQSFETLEPSGVKGSPTGAVLPPQLSATEAPTPGMEDALISELTTNWAPEEASGEASEGSVLVGAELSFSRMREGSTQAEGASAGAPSASPTLLEAAMGSWPVDRTGTSLPMDGPSRPSGQAWRHIPRKKGRASASLGDPQDSSRIPALYLPGLSSPSTLSAQPGLPKGHSWGNMLPLRELEGKRSTRDRRSSPDLEGGQASEGAARPPTRFNMVPLTDTGHNSQRSNPQLPGFVFHLLVPSIILVLLAVGGLLFYRWKQRSHRKPQTVDSPMEQPEGSPLTQDEDRQVELPV